MRFVVRSAGPPLKTLTAMAEAAAPAFAVGEVDTAPGYFSASGVEELISRLYTVSLQSQPCAFKLQREVAPTDLVVSFDREEIVSCEGECDSGYSYDELTGEVQFHEETCAALRNGAPHELWFGDREYMND